MELFGISYGCTTDCGRRHCTDIGAHPQRKVPHSSGVRRNEGKIAREAGEAGKGATSEEEHSVQRCPSAQVFVGHISVVLGHLRYEERLTDSFAFRVGMAVAISCLVIVALVVAGVCWHRRRRRRRKTKRQQAAMSSAAPNPYIGRKRQDR